MAVAVAVAVAVSGGESVAVAGLTKRSFNHIQKDFLINVWGYYTLPPFTRKPFIRNETLDSDYKGPPK